MNLSVYCNLASWNVTLWLLLIKLLPRFSLICFDQLWWVHSTPVIYRQLTGGWVKHVLGWNLIFCKNCLVSWILSKYDSVKLCNTLPSVTQVLFYFHVVPYFLNYWQCDISPGTRFSRLEMLLQASFVSNFSMLIESCRGVRCLININ